jgi:16S rRNA G966 N2-methylase RsmD
MCKYSCVIGYFVVHEVMWHGCGGGGRVGFESLSRCQSGLTLITHKNGVTMSIISNPVNIMIFNAYYHIMDPIVHKESSDRNVKRQLFQLDAIDEFSFL